MLAPNDDLAEYLLDNYGSCRRGPLCQCLRGGWLGRGCSCWKPAGVRNWEELDALMRSRYGIRSR